MDCFMRMHLCHESSCQPVPVDFALSPDFDSKSGSKFELSVLACSCPVRLVSLKST